MSGMPFLIKHCASPIFLTVNDSQITINDAMDVFHVFYVSKISIVNWHVLNIFQKLH